MSHARWFVISVVVFQAGCPSFVEMAGKKKDEGAKTTVPTPTAEDPLNGLPALSAEGAPARTMALATLSVDEAGQERSITFIGLGELDPSTSKTLQIPTAPPAPFLDTLTKTYREGAYQSQPWVATPDDPPLPMTMTVAGTELYFAGDPRTRLSVAVTADAAEVGRDEYQVEGESQTSPEHVIKIGATVLWSGDAGFAYVRYDVADGSGRESDWRIITLTKKAKAEPAK